MEIWKKWYPANMPNLDLTYELDVINDNPTAFSIMLSNKKNAVMLSFSHAVRAYRYYLKEYKKELMETLAEQYSEPADILFFEVEQSEYLQWLSHESSTLTDYFGLRHFCLVTATVIIDFALSHEPQWVYSIKKLRSCFAKKVI